MRIKKMYRIYAAWMLFGLMISSLLFPFAAHANNMTQWSGTVALQSDGSAIITEHRRMNLDSGTEVYIALNHLEGAEVREFSVSENGQPFQSLERWDVDADRSAKAGKSGIHPVDGGVELCWGVGNYGPHEYEVRYVVDGLVRQLQDGQSMFWRFYNEATGIPPQSYNLRITAPFAMNESNAKIWGFGYEGDIHFQKDGSVLLTGQAPLQDDQHITALVQFTDGAPFTPRLSAERTLESEQAMALEGAIPGENDADSGTNEDNQFHLLIPPLLTVLLLGSPLFLRMIKRGHRAVQHYGIRRKEAEERNKDKYYRDVPYTDGPMENVCPLLQPFGSGNAQEVISAYILKWVMEGRLSTRAVVEERIFRKDKPSLELIFPESQRQDTEVMSPIEKDLWKMLTAAAGKDFVLEDTELTRWATDHYETFTECVDALQEKTKPELIQQDYLRLSTQGRFFKVTETHLTETGEALVDRLLQYRNYMKDFTLLEERGSSEVILWRELLIWSAMFGLAEEVAKELQTFVPDVMENLPMDFNDIFLMHMLSQNLYRSAYAQEMHDSMAISGGGGSSFMGGGGGSFGGGMGGGVR